MHPILSKNKIYGQTMDYIWYSKSVSIKKHYLSKFIELKDPHIRTETQN